MIARTNQQQIFLKGFIKIIQDSIWPVFSKKSGGWVDGWMEGWVGEC